jgi:hypothetical protein
MLDFGVIYHDTLDSEAMLASQAGNRRGGRSALKSVSEYRGALAGTFFHKVWEDEARVKSRFSSNILNSFARTPRRCVPAILDDSGQDARATISSARP